MQTIYPKLSQPLVETSNGVCVAGHELEAEAGAGMLEQGGNACDALVASAFMGFVVEQIDCGLGGFAHISVWDNAKKNFHEIDGYVTAPLNSHEAMFEVADGVSYYGHPFTQKDAAKYGPLAVAVPGAVASLCYLHENFGSLSLSQVLTPAIDVAREGITFNWRDRLSIAGLQDTIRKFPDTAAVLLPNDKPPNINVQFPQAHEFQTDGLARTLEYIANHGRKGFYTGKPAEKLSDYIKSLGGIVEKEDFVNYDLKVFKNRHKTYRGHEYVTCRDSVGYQALNILENHDLKSCGAESFLYRHLMAEALGISYTDNIAYYGDPNFVSSPLEALESKAYAAWCADRINPEKALDRPLKPGNAWDFEKTAKKPARNSTPETHGTSQMLAADKHGNIAAVITAFGWDYGSLVYEPDTGIFMNNGMSYFDPRPGRPNSIGPGKRPMFGAPCIVMTKDSQPVFAACGSGGYRITTGVLHALINTIDHGMDISSALDHPRVHMQGNETFVDHRLATGILEELQRAGHIVIILKEEAAAFNFGRVCALSVDAESHRIQASAYPHWLTAVAVPS
jgi:gamma-glutamyltranspeptidase / glutathione hydrolase